MNRDGSSNPRTSFDSSIPTSPHDGESITNHTHSRSLDDGDNNAPNLLSTCAKTDQGGGVSLNRDVFAIYSTAALPPLWTGIVQNTSPAGEDAAHIERLRDLASAISRSLPIYTSWNDVLSQSSSSEDHRAIQIHSCLTTSQIPSTATTARNLPSLIRQQKPHFLINAALHTKHCLIGQGSMAETLLVVLRRPWCVLEICVSNIHNTKVLETILAFARVAQKWDYSGYSTAVFLLGYEIEARRRTQEDCFWNHHHCQGRTYPSYIIPSRRRRVYEICNTTVFLPSLRSFNSFWIRLICVCALELGVGFSDMVRLLCDRRHRHRQRGQRAVVEHDESIISCYKPDSGFSRIDIESLRDAGRRNSSTIDLCPSSRHIVEKEEEDGDGDEEDIVQTMFDVYNHVLRRIGDSI